MRAAAALRARIKGIKSMEASELVPRLEELLRAEGLGSRPSPKEICAFKAKRELDKELDGIDTSAIISSKRRRTASSSYREDYVDHVSDDEE